MLARTGSVAILGADARSVAVEVHIGMGVPRFSIVGLPTRSVQEAEQRTRAAMEVAGETWPRALMVANLAPGALRKEGSHFDLPIALGVLAADDRLPKEALDGWIVVGELGLDGAVRPVPGVLAAAVAARRAGAKGVICPAENAGEAALVSDIEVVGVPSLAQARDFLKGAWAPGPAAPPPDAPLPVSEDMSDVRGHAGARRAAEIAAAGGHNLLLVGPPGSGKTMLARRIPGILPEMSDEESLDVTRIHSVAGLLIERPQLIRARPFRAPHHNVTMAGLIGGGQGLPRPGEVCLAHHGVLFLDELALYRSDALEALRGPVEDGVVRIVRSGGAVSYPCRFSLVAATNPCPCGYLGDERGCRCTYHRLDTYRARLSGPLLDRFDLEVTMARPPRAALMSPASGDRSMTIRARVEAARAAQAARYGSPSATNASVPKAMLESAAALSERARATLMDAIDALHLSGRGVDRVIRVGRTIADLAGKDAVGCDHIEEALALRARVKETVAA